MSSNGQRATYLHGLVVKKVSKILLKKTSWFHLRVCRNSRLKNNYIAVVLHLRYRYIYIFTLFVNFTHERLCCFQNVSAVCEYIVHRADGHITGVARVLLHTTVPVHTRQRPIVGKSSITYVLYCINYA